MVKSLLLLVLKLKTVLTMVLLGAAMSVFAVDSLTLLALFGDKALLHVDGERRLLQAGETSPEGIVLISADPERAVVEVDGRREQLYLGLAAEFPGTETSPDPAWSGPQTVSLWADDTGFFYASGSINGYPVRFLVDTGATTIAMNRQMAQRIGIDLKKGRNGLANTAAGVARMVEVNLDQVNVGGITLSNIDAGVLLGNHPETPLLGMSFLNQLDMVRENNRMDLKRRN